MAKCSKTNMTLDEAIAHAEEHIDDTPCGQNHRQLAEWLKELRELKQRLDGNAALAAPQRIAMEDNNMAACREALEAIADSAKRGSISSLPSASLVLRTCEIALSAPARNCDLARDWLQDLYCKFEPPAIVRCEMPPEWVDAVMAFCKWLLAPAAVRKGEGK